MERRIILNVEIKEERGKAYLVEYTRTDRRGKEHKSTFFVPQSIVLETGKTTVSGKETSYIVAKWWKREWGGEVVRVTTKETVQIAPKDIESWREKVENAFLEKGGEWGEDAWGMEDHSYVRISAKEVEA